jgi:hypothetical protein
MCACVYIVMQDRTRDVSSFRADGVSLHARLLPSLFMPAASFFIYWDDRWSAGVLTFEDGGSSLRSLVLVLGEPVSRVLRVRFCPCFFFLSVFLFWFVVACRGSRVVARVAATGRRLIRGCRCLAFGSYEIILMLLCAVWMQESLMGKLNPDSAHTHSSQN